MKNKYNYFLDAFKRSYLIEHLPEIGYGNLSSNISIKQSVPEDFFNKKVAVNAEEVVWKEWKNTRIPFLFDSIDDEVISFNGKSVIINFDIVASGFYLLSGYQELDKSKRDNLGRFLYSESIQHKLGITAIPVVNYYFDILKTAIEKVHGISLKPKYSVDGDFKVCLTHDIDNCSNGWLEGSAWAVKNKKYFAPFSLLYQRFIKQKDIWYNFETLLDIEKQYDAKSSFYFLCKKGKYLGKSNADYHISNHKFQKVFRKIRASGSEVGIHGSFGTHSNLELLKKDIEVLNQPVLGGRFHFLEFEMDLTPHILEQAGLKYDSTLSFAEHIGFRNSCCTPFPLFNFKENRTSSVLEIPLNIMDGTLSGKSYMNLSPEQSIESVKSLIEEVHKFNGVLTILWHNTYYSDYKYKGWREIMEKILQICKQKNAQIISAESVYNQVAIK
jgi:hypothetical protein